MNEIRKTVDLNAPPERVWSMLTRPQEMASWLMTCDMTPVPGNQFTFTAPAAGRWDGKIYCEVREVIENERISYTWNANDIGVETLVVFDLEPISTGTRLTLVHRGLAGAMGGAAGRHAAGWTRCLKALQASLTGSSAAYDWSEFQITYHVDAPLGEVFRLWATADGMKRFWGDEVEVTDAQGSTRPDSDEYRNGDRIRIGFPTHTSTELEILNIEQNHFLLFSFGTDYGWVRVILADADGRTRIELTQFGLPLEGAAPWHIHANARGWWIANLLNIQSVLVHGYDLRVRQPGCEGGLATQFDRGPESAADLHDWSSFDVFLYIDAPVDRVMEYWRTTGGLQSFFIADIAVGSTEDSPAGETRIKSGDPYTWRWIHGHRLSGEFLQADKAAVGFTFGGDYRVTVDATGAGDGSLLHLNQRGMADSESERVSGSLNCRSCWIYFLVNLKSVLEAGNDLRDHNPETADSVSVGYNLAAH